MSDQDTSKVKSRAVNAWSEHEVLVYVLSAIEHTGTKIDYANAPCPAGRNANGCAQKILKIKNALRAEIDAVKKGGSIATAGASYATPKKTGGRKRKTATDEDSEGTPKKRGRAKKNADPEMEAEVTVKNEPEGELSIEEEEEEV